MKSNSWKKEWVVISYSDYDNTWSELTIPLTFKQASAFIHNARYLKRLKEGLVKMVTLEDFAKIFSNPRNQRIQSKFSYQAPYNPEFLGAQPPKANQDY